MEISLVKIFDGNFIQNIFVLKRRGEIKVNRFLMNPRMTGCWNEAGHESRIVAHA